MTVRFAASCDAARSPVARMLASVPARAAVNDNAEPPAIATDMAAALRLFGQHGLGAAQFAHDAADAAGRAGDEATRTRWLALCRCLNRRLAMRLETLA